MVKVSAFTMTFFCPQHCPSGDTPITGPNRGKSRRKGLRLVMFHVKQICKI